MSASLASKLQVLADETNDAADHDELHAAAEVVRLRAGLPYDESYLNRWIQGLLQRTLVMCPACNDYFDHDDEQMTTPPVCDFCRKAGRS